MAQWFVWSAAEITSWQLESNSKSKLNSLSSRRQHNIWQSTWEAHGKFDHVSRSVPWCREPWRCGWQFMCKMLQEEWHTPFQTVFCLSLKFHLMLLYLCPKFSIPILTSLVLHLNLQICTRITRIWQIHWSMMVVKFGMKITKLSVVAVQLLHQYNDL